MKKVLLTLGLVISLAVSAQANIYVNWGSGSGFYELGGGAGGLLASGDSTALVQLIWSLDSTADAATMANANFVSGDDVWLANFVVNQATHGDYADSLIYTTTDDGGSTDLTGGNGFIYARIFQDSVVQANDYYYYGLLDAVTVKDPVGPPADTPQDYNMSQNFGDYLDQGATYGQVLPVPEPGTMMLFGLGLATLGFSRKRKRA